MAQDSKVTAGLWLLWFVLFLLALRNIAGRRFLLALAGAAAALLFWLLLSWVWKKIGRSVEAGAENVQLYAFAVLPVIWVVAVLVVNPAVPISNEGLCVLEYPRAIAYNCSVGNDSKLIYDYNPDFSVVDYAEYGRCSVHDFNATYHNYRFIGCNASQPFPEITKVYNLAVVGR